MFLTCIARYKSIVKNVKNSRRPNVSNDFERLSSSSILISRVSNGSTRYILGAREGTRVAWHDDTPFPRCKLSGRACVSRISLINVHIRASCRYLTGLSPASPPVSIIPSHDFSYRDPLANAEQRGYTSSKLLAIIVQL